MYPKERNVSNLAYVGVCVHHLYMKKKSLIHFPFIKYSIISKD